ncbi:MAG: hypothetical protein CJBNEKGG_03542 [Prosthecobacter sp.]|nr:hypothetical protein [Prosthecobacter sp.]
MSRQRLWITTLALLAALWSAVALVMHETDDLVSWPGKVQELVENAPWLAGEKLSDEKRRGYLARVITNYQRLDVGQRKSLREDAQEALDKFFASLSEEEQKVYVNRTIQPLFEVIDRGLKVMPVEDRKRLVTRMRGDLKNLRGGNAEGDRLAEQDRKFMEDLMAEDPLLFLRGASVKQKLELAPVLEDMQSRVQGLRR